MAFESQTLFLSSRKEGEAIGVYRALGRCPGRGTRETERACVLCVYCYGEEWGEGPGNPLNILALAPKTSDEPSVQSGGTRPWAPNKELVSSVAGLTTAFPGQALMQAQTSPGAAASESQSLPQPFLLHLRNCRVASQEEKVPVQHSGRQKSFQAIVCGQKAPRPVCAHRAGGTR